VGLDRAARERLDLVHRLDAAVKRLTRRLFAVFLR
jgi:hypothetical protein